MIEVTKKTAFLYRIFNNVRSRMEIRRGGISQGEIIALVFGVILTAALLPTGIGMWINVTAAGGLGAGWSSSIKTIWNVAPIMMVVSAVAAFVVMKRR